jgi:hypothetical protein
MAPVMKLYGVDDREHAVGRRRPAIEQSHPRTEAIAIRRSRFRPEVLRNGRGGGRARDPDVLGTGQISKPADKLVADHDRDAMFITHAGDPAPADCTSTQIGALPR